jgi:hypothetical protein
VFVTPGPANDNCRYTGCRGETLSSSASVGKRGAPGAGTSWLRSKPPIDVIHSPPGSEPARASSKASTSPIDAADSIRVSCPGRSPSSTM